MKRFLPVVLCLALILALAVPVLADTVYKHDFMPLVEQHGFRFFIFADYGDSQELLLFNDLPVASWNETDEEYDISFRSSYKFYLNTGEGWVLDGSYSGYIYESHYLMNFDLLDADGNVVHSKDVDYYPPTGEDGSAGSIDADGLMGSIVGGLSAFSTGNLIIIIGAVLGITVAPVLLWFGFNFAKRKLMGAMKKGKL